PHPPRGVPSSASLLDLGVAGLGRGLAVDPPRAVVPVPLDRLLETAAQISVARLPAEFGPQPAGVDRVAQVVPGPVDDAVVPVGGVTVDREEELQHLPVAALAVGPDQVGLAEPAAVDDRPDGGVVVVDMNPVP